jgi:SAM-dependent methyltransferase
MGGGSDDTGIEHARNTVLQRYASSAVDRLGVVLLHDSPTSRLLRRPIWKRAYSTYCRDCLSRGLMTFLNLGFLSDPDELADDDTAGIADRVSERLYDRIVGDTDLAGKTALEIGCGPGGGSAYLARTRHPASFIGVDLNRDMISWCSAHHDLPNLQFRQGDAQDLPVESNSIDAAINVESSHCYPSRLRFFEEVNRVLRPGGSFLFADVVVSDGNREASGAVSARLKEAGLTIDECTDITENVLTARDLVSRSPAFRAHMRESLSPLTLPLVEQALYLSGTTTYERLVSRDTRYMQWRASKPGEGSTAGGGAETGEGIAG